MTTIEQNIFKRSKVNFAKLTNYGFIRIDNQWVYEKLFMSGDFKAIVNIDANGNIAGTVYETDSDDIYFPLRVESMAAGFAGEVRTEYEKILQDIKLFCCRTNCFLKL